MGGSYGARPFSFLNLGGLLSGPDRMNLGGYSEMNLGGYLAPAPGMNLGGLCGPERPSLGRATRFLLSALSGPLCVPCDRGWPLLLCAPLSGPVRL